MCVCRRALTKFCEYVAILQSKNGKIESRSVAILPQAFGHFTRASHFTLSVLHSDFTLSVALARFLAATLYAQRLARQLEAYRARLEVVKNALSRTISPELKIGLSRIHSSAVIASFDMFAKSLDAAEVATVVEKLMELTWIDKDKDKIVSCLLKLTQMSGTF